ncbi:RNA methyltransferase [Streptomyces sp. AJS327]|uniref:TrmH family RNA methyltransferase n=1 Tax=Streptomyces sp. AJS327 TaxID=2545265 RepID=UPI0015DDC7C5|nr:RNA methyltransferase [Streptomyces sp. AJS327]MBA0050764.1 RNA methyltransferase [Streptomyces sp. AJS327]
MADLITVDDPDDPRLADYTRLTDVALRRRREPAEGLFIAEGEKVIRRARQAGYRMRSMLLSEKWTEAMADVLAEDPAPAYLVAPELAERVTGYHVHRGALASMAREPLPAPGRLLADAGHQPTAREPGESVPRRSRIAVLEDFVDHTNVGAVFRAAAALGVDAVLVTPRCADPLYRRSVKVSMGTVFQVPWTRIEGWPDSVDALREAGYVVAGMTLGQGAITLDQLVAEDHVRLALVFGAEGHGLTPAADRRLDQRVTIPMTHGVDSLNVAASSAVAFYATRSRTGA